ncbi:MAG: TorF family putative porin [Pseudobdellovibrionaceae bacterium]
MPRLNLCTVAFLTSTLLCAPQLAHSNESANSVKITGNTTFASDYIFRGYSQTDENAAIQGSIGVTHDSGVSLSVWGSNLDFTDASIEVDTTLSYTFPVGSSNVTLGGIYYAYPGADADLNYDYVEAFGGVSRSFAEYGDYSLQAFVSPDYFAGSGTSVYTIASATIPTPVENLSVVGSAAYQWIEDNAQFAAPDYADWSAGLIYTYQNIAFTARYQDTSVQSCSSLCDARVVGSVSVNF